MSLEYSCKTKNTAMLQAVLAGCRAEDLPRTLACCIEQDFADGFQRSLQFAEKLSAQIDSKVCSDLFQRCLSAESCACLKILLGLPLAKQRRGLLLLAAKRQGELNIDIICAIIEEIDDALLDEVDSDGNTVLHLVASDKMVSAPSLLQVFEAFKRRRPNVRDFINKLNRNGDTVLHLCIWQTYNIVVNWLLDHGADATIPNTSGNTPIILASIEGFCRMITMFVDKLATEFNNDDDSNKLAYEVFTRRNQSGVSCLEILIAKDHVCCLQTIQNAFGFIAFFCGKHSDYDSPQSCHLLNTAVDRLSTKSLHFLLLNAIANVSFIECPADFTDQLSTFLRSRALIDDWTLDLSLEASLSDAALLHDTMWHLLRVLPAQPKGRFSWHSADPQQKRLAIAYMLLRVGAFPRNSKFSFCLLSLKHACAVTLYRHLSYVIYSHAKVDSLSRRGSANNIPSDTASQSLYADRVKSLVLPESIKSFLLFQECVHFL